MNDDFHKIEPGDLFLITTAADQRARSNRHREFNFILGISSDGCAEATLDLLCDGHIRLWRAVHTTWRPLKSRWTKHE